VLILAIPLNLDYLHVVLVDLRLVIFGAGPSGALGLCHSKLSFATPTQHKHK